MSDEWALFAVLGLVYLTDCFCWAGASTVAFVGAVGGRRARKMRGHLLQTGEGGLVFLNPLPPLGMFFCCRLFPLVVSPRGFSTQQASGSLSRETGASVTTVPWSERLTFEARNRDVILDGKRLLRCDDVRQAREVGTLLNQLRAAPQDARFLLIDRFWTGRFDRESARARLDSATSRMRGLRLACIGLFVLLFVVAPTVVLYVGRVDMLVPLGLAALAIVAWIAIRFNAVFKSCFPEDGDERVTHLIKMVLCPPASIRACDRVTENLLGEYHPLVVAHLLMRPERFKALAAETLRFLRFPIVPSLEAGYAEPIAWQNDILLRKAEQFLQMIGLRTIDLLAPPDPHAPDVQAYCPRCLEQFMEAAGECPDCVGVMRAPFGKRRGVRDKRR